MVVYVVKRVFDYGDGDYICGVFSSREKANAYIDKALSDHPSLSADDYDVTAFVVDGN